MQYHEPPAPAQALTRNSRFWLLLIAAVAAIALAGGVLVGEAKTSRTPGLLPASAKIELFNEATVQDLYAAAIPAVVKIETSQVSQGLQERGMGSGFLVDNQGNILTNNHVVAGAQRVTVILQNGQRTPGTVLGTDPSNDIALIHVDPAVFKNVPALTLGDSSTIQPGQMAIALGSPYGLQGTVTVGIISGTNRTLPSDTRRSITGVIQTDAAIFPGNSGGPLLNSKGEVIGINTAVATATNGEAGLGFAVPINTAKAALSSLATNSVAAKPWLGVSLVSLGTETDGLSLGVNNGVYVVQVVAGSPAEHAGLKAAPSSRTGTLAAGGDVIIAADGRIMTKTEDLIGYIGAKKPGDKVALTLWRDGQQVTISVTLGTWPTK